jgi:hypothetical protein
MDKTNMSEEERQLCCEIIETGQKKFRRELQKLADLAQAPVDVKCGYNSELAHKMCDICRWLSNACLARPDQCKAAGIWVIMNPDKGYGQYRRMSVEDGADEYMLEWEHYTYSDDKVSLPREPDSGCWPANRAMDAVANALNQLRRLQSLVIKYMKLKNEIDDLEHEESLDRVAKFRHQLELLKKL